MHVASESFFFFFLFCFMQNQLNHIERDVQLATLLQKG